MGKQAEAEQGPIQQTPGKRTALRGQTRPQGAEHTAFFRKSREDRCPMAMFRLQGTQLDHQTGLQIMPEGPASRAHTSKASTTTLDEWCQQGCPSYLLRCGRERREHGSQKPRQDKAKEDKEAIKEKAESLQQVLDDLPDDSLLRPDFEAQLQSLQGQLEDKRSKGARLDSAEARLRRAEASLAKKEQALEDAAKALDEAKQEADEAKKTLEEVRATMVPNTVAEPNEEEETVLKLGLADVHDLHKLLHNLQARIHNSSEAERPAKKSRDNTGAGTAQPQDETQTNDILHRALGNLSAVVQAHQPQQVVGPATPAASQAPTLPGQVGHTPGGGTPGAHPAKTNLPPPAASQSVLAPGGDTVASTEVDGDTQMGGDTQASAQSRGT